MEPTFIDLPGRKFVGIGAKFISMLSPDRNTTKVIPPLWHAFMQRQGEIADRVGPVSYGLVMPLSPDAERSHKDEMFYVACAEVSQVGTVPAGMVSGITSAGRYAVFTHKGKLDLLGVTIQQIYGIWLPANRSLLRDGPHIERYDQRFDPGSDTSEFDTLVPVLAAV